MISPKYSFLICIFSLLLFFKNSANAESWNYQTRGFLLAKLSSYTETKSRNFGQSTHAQIEQAASLGENLSALNQLRWNGSSINNDLSTKSTPQKKDNFDLYPGENYLKYKSDTWIAQVGYQEIVWGESFGFNYADIVNPKDLRQTFFDDTSESRFPILLFNGKTFFSSKNISGSMQFIYSPEPNFSKTLPLDLYAGNLFPQENLIVIKEKKHSLFSESEVGGKLSASLYGFDLSFFTFSYLDREPHYTLESASNLSITLRERHSKIKSSGLSFAKTIYDFVLRTDIVRTESKTINYFDNSILKSFSSNSLNSLISLDVPSFYDYSGIFILAQSTLDTNMLNSFRKKNEQYFTGKLSKKLESDKKLELSYTQELNYSGHSIQTLLSWPINNINDLKIGGEFYFGNDSSNLKKYKNINSVFFSVKNYFQL